tara:strand:+ start:2494 stop:2610 length:117 start_codon:yes stop_codon:yes gene_type:complete
MSFDINWHPKIRKFLRKLSPEISKRIVKKIKEIRKKSI